MRSDRHAWERKRPMKHEAPLSLHIPEARFRPGDAPDFGYLKLAKAGAGQAAEGRCKSL